MSYWVVHMKDGQDLRFDKKARYVDTLNGCSNCLAMMESKYGKPLAIIPTENIRWIESVEEGD